MKKVFGKRITSKKDGGVESIAGQGVAKQRKSIGKTSRETGRRPRVESAEAPQGEIADQEELQSAEEDGAANPSKRARMRNPPSDGHAGRKADVDDEHQLVQSCEKISCKQSRQRQHKSRPAVAEKCAGKNGHGPDGREVYGVWKNPDGGGDNDEKYSDKELERVEMAIAGFAFSFHGMAPSDRKM